MQEVTAGSVHNLMEIYHGRFTVYWNKQSEEWIRKEERTYSKRASVGLWTRTRVMLSVCVRVCVLYLPLAAPGDSAPSRHLSS